MLCAWEISGDQITFTITQPASILDAGAAWWGFGINADGESKMAGADLYMIYRYGTGTERLVDSYATANARPIDDSTSHVSVSFHGSNTNGDGSFVTVFSRSLDTGEDSQDRKLVDGEEYELQLSYGTITGGVANEHAKKDRVHTGITLDNDFTKTLDDRGEEDDYSVHLTAFLGILGMLLFIPY